MAPTRSAVSVEKTPPCWVTRGVSTTLLPVGSLLSWLISTQTPSVMIGSLLRFALAGALLHARGAGRGAADAERVRLALRLAVEQERLVAQVAVVDRQPRVAVDVAGADEGDEAAVGRDVGAAAEGEEVDLGAAAAGVADAEHAREPGRRRLAEELDEGGVEAAEALEHLVAGAGRPIDGVEGAGLRAPPVERRIDHRLRRLVGEADAVAFDVVLDHPHAGRAGLDDQAVGGAVAHVVLEELGAGDETGENDAGLGSSPSTVFCETPRPAPRLLSRMPKPPLPPPVRVLLCTVTKIAGGFSC